MESELFLLKRSFEVSRSISARSTRPHADKRRPTELNAHCNYGVARNEFMSICYMGPA